jgi:hypothetical protein
MLLRLLIGIQGYRSFQDLATGVSHLFYVELPQTEKVLPLTTAFLWEYYRMSTSVGIVGGGWYGCHIASTLRSLGFNVRIFERASRLMHLSSGNNQFRLHLGFHYARHHRTRIQSRDGFWRFVERYPELSKTVNQNIYAVPLKESSIDFQTYKIIMSASGIEFIELGHLPEQIVNIQGALLTSERVLLTSAARNYFSGHLQESIVLDYCVSEIEQTGKSASIDGQNFDFVIDTTWGHFTKSRIDVIYEPTLLLYYELIDGDFPAITFVDGPLCSVYPTENPKIFTLSSVPHTPLGQFQSSQEASLYLSTVSRLQVDRKKQLMENQISFYVPSFNSRFRFIGPQLAIKTKPVGALDDRSCYVHQKERVFSVMSGKVDNIFFAAEQIIERISMSNELNTFSNVSTLFDDIGRTTLGLKE